MKYPAWIGALVIGVVLAPLAIAQGPGGSSMRDGYVPRLGDIMGDTQLRHLKLWYAGKLRNWQLADYELGQIRASFEDAATLYPGIPVTDMSIVAKPLQTIGDAINAKDGAKFARAFSELTTACNACHQAIGRGFIVITAPGASPFSNQSFQPRGGQ
jgi:hypothetical protein